MADPDWVNEWVAGLPAEALATWIERHGDQVKERYQVEDVHFALWLHYMDKAIARVLGLTHRDLEDYDYYSMYEGDYSPREAALQALEDLGYGYDMEDAL